MSNGPLPANLLTEWARLIAQSLVDASVREVVVSPGSRSTAFVLAVAAHPELRLHDCIDERAAAFFALGQARLTGRPSLLLCTSGTAPAHYYPAVIEATRSGIPLLVMSADRPLELVDCAAPQTIDQVKLFGDHVRSYVELGMADPAPRALRATRRAIAQAVFTTRWPQPGAVHLNVRARKPFEPRGATTPPEAALAEQVQEILARPIPRPLAPQSLPDRQGLAQIAEAIRGRPRGLILCGPGPLRQAAGAPAVHHLSRLTGWPLLAETPSQLRFGTPNDVLSIDAFDTLLSEPRFRAENPPEVILQLGAPPTASSVERYLDAHPTIHRIVLAEGGWNDWLSSAQDLVFGALPESVAALADQLGPSVLTEAHERWRSRWEAGNLRAWEATEAALQDAPPMNEATVIQRLIRTLPDGALLMVGNSLAVRLVDWYGSSKRGPLSVLSQRGANGIDGLIAGAAGAVSAANQPVTLILGDVSALHDLHGLLLARGLDAPLAILLLNNGGGRIFELLPAMSDPQVPPSAHPHLTTPHTLDFAAAAHFYGVQHRLAEDLSALDDALAAAHRRPGCTLIEVRCPPHGASALRRQIRAHLGANG